MPKESRLNKSLINAQVNLLFYFLSLILAFFSRKIFLDLLGANFMGLSGTMTNLLNFLHLAELGIGSAIGYVLYKPLFEQDEKKINEIISVFGYIYKQIGFIILSIGFLISCCLPLIFSDTEFPMGVIYFFYYSLLSSSLLGYFFNYKQTLLGADQKNYIITAYFQSALIAKTILQIVATYYTKNYYLWIALDLLSGISYTFILNWKIKQVYPWLESEISQGKLLFKKYPEVIKYTKQLFIHKIGTFVQSQSAPLFIYAFVSLKTVAFYGNYTLIIDKITQLINNLLGSTSAGVGNLIAEGDQQKIQQVFWELLSIRFLLAGIISFALLQLTGPFISIWLGKEYVLPQYILALLVLNAFIAYTRGATDQFLFGYGLFRDTWAPFVEVCMNISIASIGGWLWGLPGVLLGGSVSLLIIVGIWKPYFLYSQGFKTSVVHYWINYFKHLGILLVIGATCFYLFPAQSFAPEVSFIHWIKYGVILTTTYAILAYILLYLATPGIKSFTKRIVKKIKRFH